LSEQGHLSISIPEIVTQEITQEKTLKLSKTAQILPIPLALAVH
jgi:hypothetical protein